MQETYSKKAVRNAVYVLLNWVVGNVFGMIFWIILAKLLLPSELGIYSAIFNLALLLAGFAVLGLNTASTKLVSEYSGKGDNRKIEAFNYYVFKIASLSLLIFSLIFFIFGNLISTIFNLGSFQLFLSLLVLILLSYFSLSGSIIFGLGKMKELVIRNLIFTFVKFIFSIFFVLIGFSYFGVLGGILIAYAVAVFYALRFIKIKKGKVEKDRIWLFATSSIIGVIGGNLWSQGGVLITKALSTAAATGMFTLALTISIPLGIVPGSLITAISPLESEAWEKGRKQTVRNLISKALKYSFMFSIPVLLIFLIFSKEIILFVGSREYIEAASFIKFLVIGLAFAGIGNIYSTSLYYIGKPKISTNLGLLRGMMVFLLGIPLAMYYGIFGISFAYLIAGVVFFLVSVWFSKKYIGVSFEKKYLFLTIFSSFTMLPVLYLFRVFLPNIFGIVAASVIFAFGYIYLLLRLGFFDKKDVELLKIIGKKLPANIRKKLKIVEKILAKYVN